MKLHLINLQTTHYKARETREFLRYHLYIRVYVYDHSAHIKNKGIIFTSMHKITAFVLINSHLNVSVEIEVHVLF